MGEIRHKCIQLESKAKEGRIQSASCRIREAFLEVRH